MTRRMVYVWRGGRLGLLALLLGGLLAPAASWAQGQVGPNDACRTLRTNVSGTAGADILVSTSAVTVIAANQSLCSAVVMNRSSTQPLRCRAIPEGDPTAAAGFPLDPGASHVYGLESQRGVRCVLDTTATGDATVAVGEVSP